MMLSALIAIPVHNERNSIGDVLERTLVHGHDVLVVNDGSTDGTERVLQSFGDRIIIATHSPNRGYGAALKTAFQFAVATEKYDAVVTLDSDGQHEPELIPLFIDSLTDVDIVSGSRYLRDFEVNTPAPSGRRRINSLITDQLNARFGFELTDSFCGFKAYRTSVLSRMDIRNDGYAMPLELWVEAACLDLRIVEIPVPRVYLDANRSFGGALDDGDRRLAHYQTVIDETLERLRKEKRDCRCRLFREQISIADR